MAVKTVLQSIGAVVKVAVSMTATVALGVMAGYAWALNPAHVSPGLMWLIRGFLTLWAVGEFLRGVGALDRLARSNAPTAKLPPLPKGWELFNPPLQAADYSI